ncbi:MAG: ABC transporter substrate-binding protein [Omnitrophica WOR_2 bacterium]
MPPDEALSSSKPPVSERRPVAILFTDIAGSTSMAEKLDPEEWKEVVSGAHRLVSAAVCRYEGTIAQFLGDGVLAYFGAPVTHEDDPQRAVQAALEIQQALHDFRRQLAGMVEDFQMRIGIHTGTVVVGQVGDSRHTEYLAVGDAVNLAARLQAAARPGGILVSQAVARLAQVDFDFADLGEIQVKGKTAPVHVYEVLGPLKVPHSGHGIPGLSSPMVGRESELTALLDALERLNRGSGGMVFVLGEAGIGKSRLVEEARCRSTTDARWLEGRSLSYGSNIPYGPVRQLILADLELSDGDPALRKRLSLRHRLAALLPDQVEQLTPYLNHLLGLEEPGGTGMDISILSGETLKYQLLQSVTAYCAALASQQPLVVILEDFHWADASTLETAEQLMPLTNHYPLLLVFAGRIDREHGSWRLKYKAETDYAHRCTAIQLHALESANLVSLVDHLLDDPDLPEDFHRLVVERSDGNPFYLEELLRSLIDQKTLAWEDERWRLLRRIESVEVPSTLQGVLLARIDRLEEPVRQTLQLASVIGRSFLYRILEAIAEPGFQLDTHLDELQRVDLIREKRRKPELEYTFKHSLTQEAAYHSLLLERRREYHHRVAQALENLYTGREAEFPGLLAHHYDAAGEREKAVEYLLLAGDNARLQYAFEEARQTYLRLIELLNEMGDWERSSKTWLKLGLVYQSGFDFSMAQQAYEKAFIQQKQAALIKKPTRNQVAADKENFLRWGERSFDLIKLDPGYCTSSQENDIICSLFAGLTEYDPEINTVPHAAHSWEVLDGGRRYIFHLRDNIRWTDGTPTTAVDFEWAWKRNLAPGRPEYPAKLLDIVTGARAYRLGENPDPECVGVHALDPLTLDVHLETPASYFVYLTTFPVAFPLPAHIVERYGQDWWKPPHGVYNGAFKLTEYSANSLRLVRNPGYFGDIPGSLDGIEKIFFEAGDKEMLQQVLDQKLDLFTRVSPEELTVPVPAELLRYSLGLETLAVVLNPVTPPLNDIRVRKAIACGLDFKRILNSFEIIGGARRSGGLVPPGMIGHSPELGLPFNLSLAQHLLAEAGFPGGRGFPALKFLIPLKYAGIDEMVHQLEQNLGIRCDVQVVPYTTIIQSGSGVNMGAISWIADYPDPDNYLRASYFIDFLKNKGWQHPHYDMLVAEATQSTDQAQRLKLYREADRILVNDEAIIIPFMHAIFGLDIVHPWVTGFESKAINFVSYKYIRLSREK